MAWTATAAACAFGVWDGVGAILTGAGAALDPVLALTSITVIGLVWYTYFTRETLEHARASNADDRQRSKDRERLERESLATAVLAELFGITARLANLATKGPSAATSRFISHPLLELAANIPRLFAPDAVQAIGATLRRIRDVQEYLDRYPELETASKNQDLSPTDRQRAEDQRATTYLAIRTRSAWAHNWAIRLVERLRAEGGLMPVGLDEEPVDLFQSVQLLPDPFERPSPPTDSAGA